jgi:alkylhydroperoxidase/carboxymuconolactone decarboxylase family protein YurZ
MTSSRKQRERRAASGNWNPEWESFARLDPAWAEKVVSMSIAPALSGALEPKTVEFIGIAANAVGSRLNAQGVRRHIRRAIALGATKEEITAVLQLTSMAGLQSMFLGAPILLEELDGNAHSSD